MISDLNQNIVAALKAFEGVVNTDFKENDTTPVTKRDIHYLCKALSETLSTFNSEISKRS